MSLCVKNNIINKSLSFHIAWFESFQIKSLIFVLNLFERNGKYIYIYISKRFSLFPCMYTYMHIVDERKDNAGERGTR